MITVEKAENLIFAQPLHIQSERLPIERCPQRFLDENIIADRDGPPFDRVAMDGVAINRTQYLNGRREFKIEGLQAAGDPQLSLENSENCLEAMTGAIRPHNTDLIIPYEKCKIASGLCIVEDNMDTKEFGNIHRKGKDFLADDILISKGPKINEHHLACAASAGLTHLNVKKDPAIAIISTGSELVPVSEKPELFQIRRSNVHAAEAALNRRGYNNTSNHHIKDDKAELENKLGQLLETKDILILSGGVSMGKLDYVPQVLENLRVEKIFHKIRQKPGKPMWFGIKGSKRIYALPGNPVSMLVTLHRYLLPAFDSFLSNSKPDLTYYPLGEKFKAHPKLVLFVPVKLIYSENKMTLFKVNNHGSGDYAALAESDGFAEIHPSTELIPKGTPVRYFNWKERS